jgi:hypothetical protein
VPWTSIRDSQSAFISSCYLPAGGKIKDPSKLQASEVDSMLQFWSTRQQASQEVFLFKQWQDNDKEMRRPVKEHSTDESRRRSAKRQVVDSDSEAASDSDDNQGKSPLYLSSTYHTDTVPVVPPPKPLGKSGKQQTSLPPVQSKSAARQARRSAKRQALDSDSDDNQGKSTLYLSSKYHTDTVPVVPPPKCHGKSGKQQQQQSLPPVQSKAVARQASVTLAEGKSPLYV